MRLCLALGVKHPDSLADMLTREQLADWLAFDRLEPLDADERRWSEYLAMFASANFKGDHPFRPDEFRVAAPELSEEEEYELKVKRWMTSLTAAAALSERHG